MKKLVKLLVLTVALVCSTWTGKAFAQESASEIIDGIRDTDSKLACECQHILNGNPEFSPILTDGVPASAFSRPDIATQTNRAILARGVFVRTESKINESLHLRIVCNPNPACVADFHKLLLVAASRLIRCVDKDEVELACARSRSCLLNCQIRSSRNPKVVSCFPTVSSYPPDAVVGWFPVVRSYLAKAVFLDSPAIINVVARTVMADPYDIAKEDVSANLSATRAYILSCARRIACNHSTITTDIAQVFSTDPDLIALRQYITSRPVLANRSRLARGLCSEPTDVPAARSLLSAACHHLISCFNDDLLKKILSVKTEVEDED